MFIREQMYLKGPEIFQPDWVDVYINWPGFWIDGWEYEDGSLLFLIGA